MSVSEADSPKPPTGFPGKVAGIVTLVAGLVGGTALFTTNLGTIKESWCNSIGTFCPVPVKWVISNTISVSSGGTSDNKSDVCKEHTGVATVQPSDYKHKLLPNTARFKGSRTGAVYFDGNKDNKPNPIGTSNIGWFLMPQSPAGAVSATIYARTSACETAVSISGVISVQEVPK